MARIPIWRACDPDLGSGHTAYRRASLIDLYLHAKFHRNRRNVFCGRTSETGFIRSSLSKSRPKNQVPCSETQCTSTLHALHSTINFLSLSLYINKKQLNVHNYTKPTHKVVFKANNEWQLKTHSRQTTINGTVLFLNKTEQNHICFIILYRNAQKHNEDGMLTVDLWMWNVYISKHNVYCQFQLNTRRPATAERLRDTLC